MKKIFVLMVMVSSAAVAQNRTNVWELSYSDTVAYPNSEMRYLNDSMVANLVTRSMSFFDTDGSICDTNGNLLFYSNGIYVGNRNYDTLQNSVDFNPGWLTDLYEPIGMGVIQAVLILPYPGYSEKYIIFSVSGEPFPGGIEPLHLSYSVIDMNLDGGMGGIIDTLKNKFAIEDTLSHGGLCAVKHANGRDWWVIVRQYHSNKYYKVLLTPYGVSEVLEQNIGSTISIDVDLEGCFSPDGNKFCFTSYAGPIDYMEFDRCSGEFSNSTIISPPDSGLTGCSFSPNSRYLYISTFYNLYQYDTWDSNMIANVIHVAAWDSFYDPILPVLFFVHQLAPDGKIYLSGWAGTYYLNVINSPDSLGVACDFAPHSYILPQYNFSIPSFPNYELGALTGSPCDTLSIPLQTFQPQTPTFHFSPNPASSHINIVYSVEHNATLIITNAYGIAVKQLTLYPYFKNRIVYVDDLAEGIYLVTLREGDRVCAGKMVVQR